MVGFQVAKAVGLTIIQTLLENGAARAQYWYMYARVSSPGDMMTGYDTYLSRCHSPSLAVLLVLLDTHFNTLRP
eukprot:COSAG01_NODE_129_length_24935_cov_39.324368_7_plen_74_part_00